MSDDFQDMRTAPMDGTLVNIKWTSMDGIRFDHARWNGELWVSTAINKWSGLPIICRKPEAWAPLEERP
jgi:hypothetical protein